MKGQNNLDQAMALSEKKIRKQDQHLRRRAAHIDRMIRIIQARMAGRTYEQIGVEECLLPGYVKLLESAARTLVDKKTA